MNMQKRLHRIDPAQAFFRCNIVYLSIVCSTATAITVFAKYFPYYADENIDYACNSLFVTYMVA